MPPVTLEPYIQHISHTDIIQTQTGLLMKELDTLHRIQNHNHENNPGGRTLFDMWENVNFILSKTGKRHGAVLFKCADGTGLWISHMRRTTKKISNALDQDQVPSFKLPSTAVLPKDVVDALPSLPDPPLYVPFGERPSTFQEVLGPKTCF